MDLQQAYQNFFTRYGQVSEEANKELRIWLLKPDALDKIDDVVKSDAKAARYIEELEIYIAILKMYRQELCKQYNTLATAANVPGVKLDRERLYYKKRCVIESPGIRIILILEKMLITNISYSMVPRDILQ